MLPVRGRPHSFEGIMCMLPPGIISHQAKSILVPSSQEYQGCYLI